MRLEVEHVVPHPVGRVFALMTEPASRPLWQENTQAVEALTDGPARVGTRWRETTRGVGTYEAQITALERDRLIVEHADTAAGRGIVTVRLAPEGAGATRVSMTVDIRLRGSKRLLAPALEPLIARQMPRDLARLAAVLDLRGGAASQGPAGPGR